MPGRISRQPLVAASAPANFRISALGVPMM